MILALTLLAVWYLSTWIRVVGGFIAKKHFDEPAQVERKWQYPPVSIIKTVKGSTPGLVARLQSCVNFDYPEYELILACESGDEAYKLLGNFSQTWKSFRNIATRGCVCVKLVTVQSSRFRNPKSQLMRAGFDASQFEHVLVSDENVRTGHNYLSELMADFLKNPVGLMSQAVIYDDAPGLGGKLERAYLNGFYAPSIVLAHQLKIPVVMGKSLLFKKNTFQASGDFEQLEETIAEDYEMGRMIGKAGFTVRVASRPLECSTASEIPLKAAWQRLLRWTILRKYQAPVAFFLEPFTCSWFSSLAGAWAMDHFSRHPILFFFVSLTIWFVSEVKICPHTTVIGWIIREVTAIPLWITALFCRTIKWRGNNFKIGYRCRIKPKKGE